MAGLTGQATVRVMLALVDREQRSVRGVRSGERGGQVLRSSVLICFRGNFPIKKTPQNLFRKSCGAPSSWNRISLGHSCSKIDKRYLSNISMYISQRILDKKYPETSRSYSEQQTLQFGIALVYSVTEISNIVSVNMSGEMESLLERTKMQPCSIIYYSNVS